MAAKRKRTTKKRRRSSARRRSPVTRLRRGSVYVTNPRRRRRRGYRRNPGTGRGMVGQVIGLAQDAGSALIGAAVGRTVSGMIPIGGDQPIVKFAKGTAVAIAIKLFGRRLVGERVASMAAVGAMIGPLKDVIVSFVPQSSQFLGASDGGVMYLPGIPASSLQAYAGDQGAEYVGEDTGMGSYSGDIYGG